MKRFLLSKSLLCSVIILFSSTLLFPQNRSIEFEESAWLDVLKKATEKEKLIFFDAYTTWCGPCKRLAKDIFTLDSVADFYNKNFVCAHFDMEKGEGIALAKKFRVRAYPSLLFLDSKGEVVHRHVGAPSTGNAFVKIGETALDPEGRLSYFHEQYKSGNNSGEFITKYLDKLNAAYIPKNKVISKYFETQNEDELTSQINWDIIKNHVERINSREFKYLVSHQDDYISKYTEEPVVKKIYNTYLRQLYQMIYKKEFDEVKYEALKSKIKKSNFKKADNLIITADLKFLEKNTKWKNYIELAYNNVDKYFLEDYIILNGIAWDFFEHTNKKEYLIKAEEWAKRSVEIENQAFNNDTYASIMFKLGKKEEAIKQQELALELARKEGRDVKLYEESLQRMKK